MPHEFAENEYAPDALASAARGGGPPRKSTGVDVVDPPIPPKRPPGPIPATPSSPFLRILAGVILMGIAVMVFFLLFAKH